MARRTFVGNLYKQVLYPNIVASMSGHAEEIGERDAADIDEKVIEKEIIHKVERENRTKSRTVWEELRLMGPEAK